MNRFLLLAGAAVALTSADASAAGRLRAAAGCGCAQATPVHTAPSCCSGGTLPAGVPTAQPTAPAPGPAGGHEHHSAAPPAAAAYASANLPKADKPEAKEVTLEGTLVCAKCGLKEAGVKKCTNALQVKEGGKTVTYFLDDTGNGEAYHEGLCGGGTKDGAKVTGTVTEKDGKKWVKASKVEEKK